MPIKRENNLLIVDIQQQANYVTYKQQHILHHQWYWKYNSIKYNILMPTISVHAPIFFSKFENWKLVEIKTNIQNICFAIDQWKHITQTIYPMPNYIYPYHINCTNCQVIEVTSLSSHKSPSLNSISSGWWPVLTQLLYKMDCCNFFCNT